MGLSAPLPGRPMGSADREPFSQQADPSATPAAGAPQAQPSVAPPQLQSLAANQRMQDVALQAMADALRRCGGNVSAAAKLLGVSRNTLYRKKDLLPPDCWV